MDWLDGLEKELAQRQDKGPGKEEARIVEVMIQISLNVLVRLVLQTNADMKMLPNQWDVARYHGDKRWEILDSFDFSRVGEIVLSDQRSKGVTLFAEFLLRKGVNHFRAGFIIPERIGQERTCFYYVAYEERLKDFDTLALWKRLRPGLEFWYESLIRDDLAPLIGVCEHNYTREICPSLPGNL